MANIILLISLLVILFIKGGHILYKYCKNRRRDKEDDIRYRRKLGVDYDGDVTKLKKTQTEFSGRFSTVCFKRRNMLLN